MAWALDCYSRKIPPYTPQITSFPKSRVNGQFIPIAIKNIMRHCLEIINRCKIHFWISVVNRWIYNDRPHFGADKVVLLSVAMEERGYYFRAAQPRKA